MDDNQHELPERLHTLLGAVVDGTLQPGEVEELESILMSSRAARAHFRQVLLVHGHLRIELGGQDQGVVPADDLRPSVDSAERRAEAAPISNMGELLDEELERERQRETQAAYEKARELAEAAARRKLMAPQPTGLVHRRPEPIEIPMAAVYLAVAAVAACLVVAATYLASDDNPVAPSVVEAPSPPVATIHESVDARWGVVALSTAPGTPLPTTPLQLTAGVVELELQGGARLVVEAPAELQVRPGGLARLSAGRVVGRVDEPGATLVVETPSTTIEDLGTEFGVMSHSDGTVDVHVFDGEVELTTPDAGARDSRPRQFAAGVSARAHVTGLIDDLPNLNSQRFVRKVKEIDKTRFPDGPMPNLTIPVTHDLALWLAADGIVQKNATNRVSVWGDLQVGDNRTREDAQQFDFAKQPIWVEGAIGDRPALRFDGVSTALVTQPLETTDEQTLFCVVQSKPQDVIRLASTVDNRGLQIVNYNGPPHIVLEWSQEASLRGRIFWGQGADDVAKNAATGSVCAQNRPQVVAFTYGTAGGTTRLYQGGRVVAQGDATVPAAIYSRKFIGSHYSDTAFFVGDLAELAIYNAVLSGDEIATVSAYLAEKYQVVPEEGDLLDAL